MPLENRHLEIIKNSLISNIFENCSLNRPIALGINDFITPGTDAWLILIFSDGNITSGEWRICGPLNDIDDELGVSIVVQAKEDQWRAIGAGGHEAAILAADNKSFALSGKLPYFIRHVRSTINVISNFGNTINSM